MTECCEITIPDAASVLKLSADRSQAKLLFTCRNLLGRSFPGRAELKAFDEASQETAVPAWLTVAPKHEFAKDATVSIEVTAAPDASSFVADQKLRFMLRVSNDLAPNEEFSESRAIPVELVKSAGEKKKLPAWLIPAIVGGLVLLGGIVFGLVKLLGNDDGPVACADGQACPEGQVCGTAGVCLLAVGQTCAEGAECGSGRCDEQGKCAELVATTGGACGVSFVCPALQTCDKSKNVCLGDVGFKGCADNAQCLSGHCIEGACGFPAPGTVCTTPSSEPTKECPPNQRCTRTVRRLPQGLLEKSLCLLAPKEPCEDDDLCNSLFCNKGKCNRDDLKCDDQSECLSDLKCHNGQCVIPNGSACVPNSGVDALCEGGLCSPTTKVCMVARCGSFCDPNTTECVNNQCVPKGKRVLLGLSYKQLTAVPEAVRLHPGMLRHLEQK